MTDEGYCCTGKDKAICGSSGARGIDKLMQQDGECRDDKSHNKDAEDDDSGSRLSYRNVPSRTDLFDISECKWCERDDIDKKYCRHKDPPVPPRPFDVRIRENIKELEESESIPCGEKKDKSEQPKDDDRRGKMIAKIIDNAPRRRRNGEKKEALVGRTLAFIEENNGSKNGYTGHGSGNGEEVQVVMCERYHCITIARSLLAAFEAIGMKYAPLFQYEMRVRPYRFQHEILVRAFRRTF